MNSKTKGNTFERDICKRIGTAIYGDDKTFIRSPGSGALNTIMGGILTLPKDVCISGDIMQIRHLEDHIFPYSVECKHHRDFSLEDLLLQRKKTVAYKAWEQACRDAASVERLPLLIFKKNRGEILVAMNYNPDIVGFFSISNGQITVVKLDDFLTYYHDL